MRMLLSAGWKSTSSITRVTFACSWVPLALRPSSALAEQQLCGGVRRHHDRLERRGRVVERELSSAQHRVRHHEQRRAGRGRPACGHEAGPVAELRRPRPCREHRGVPDHRPAELPLLPPAPNAIPGAVMAHVPLLTALRSERTGDGTRSQETRRSYAAWPTPNDPTPADERLRARAHQRHIAAPAAGLGDQRARPQRRSAARSVGGQRGREYRHQQRLGEHRRAVCRSALAVPRRATCRWLPARVRELELDGGRWSPHDGQPSPSGPPRESAGLASAIAQRSLWGPTWSPCRSTVLQRPAVEATTARSRRHDVAVATVRCARSGSGRPRPSPGTPPRPLPSSRSSRRRSPPERGRRDLQLAPARPSKVMVRAATGHRRRRSCRS